jgi:aryl-alcohol dehydrogenase-like predicted oxidoreductase
VALPVETLLLGGELAVAKLGFGAVRLTGPGTWGEPRDRRSVRAVLRCALDLGVNFIDTADSYGPEVSERLVAEALHPFPEELVIATKAGQRRDGPYRWRPDGRPAALRQACEASLRRLHVDQIDLYQLHAVDPAVPLTESLGALVELRAEGKVRHLGVCNVDAEQLALARSLAPIVSVQRYSLIERAYDDVLDLCERDGLAFIPWMPLARGTLAARRSGLRRIADGHSATPAQVALAWLLQRSPVMLPIPGTSSVAHLKENVAARGLQLTEQEMASLRGYRPSRRGAARTRSTQSAPNCRSGPELTSVSA